MAEAGRKGEDYLPSFSVETVQQENAPHGDECVTTPHARPTDREVRVSGSKGVRIRAHISRSDLCNKVIPAHTQLTCECPTLYHRVCPTRDIRLAQATHLQDEEGEVAWFELTWELLNGCTVVFDCVPF
jgi:hypothetical protein